MPIFSQEKAQNYLKSAIFIGYENGRQRLLGAQSINTERAFLKCELWTQWCRVRRAGFRFRRLDAGGPFSSMSPPLTYFFYF